MLNEVRAERDKLKALVDLSASLPEETDSAAISMTHEYLCVAICGRIEQDVKKILVEYARRASDAKLERAVARVCRDFMNPERAKIIGVLELFDRDFSKKLEEEWKPDDSLGRTIDRLVGQRRRIAHQTSSSRHMTRSIIADFFDAYDSLIDLFDKQFLSR